MAQLAENRQFQKTEKKQHEIEFPNGSRIIALAANSDTARGYTGDIVLDEFAFHQDADEIFKAAYGRMTNPGLQMRVISTPNGGRGKFFELAKQMALDGGFRPPRQPVKLAAHTWSGHWVDVRLAVEEGFPVDVQALREGCDEDTWQQEYCCNFLAGGSQWIPWDLFSANIEPGLVVDDNPQATGLYAGWDIARRRDLSVVWFDELMGDVTVTRGVLVMRNMPTPDQTEVVSRIMPRVHRLSIDKTGMGLPIFETTDRAFYGKVEGIGFTQQTKESMATQLKRRLEERRCRLPETVLLNGRGDDQMVWQSFRSVRKTTTTLGQVRFDAGREYDHADLFWAKCLAEAAAESQPGEHPLFTLWREDATAFKARTAADGAEEAVTPEASMELMREVVQAQMRAAVELGIFGAEKFGMRKVAPLQTSPAFNCPQCNRPCAVYGEVILCRDCGWKGQRKN